MVRDHTQQPGPCFSCCWSVMGLMAAHGAEDDVVVVTSGG
jgi:predicted metal-binding membrane protein